MLPVEAGSELGRQGCITEGHCEMWKGKKSGMRSETLWGGGDVIEGWDGLSEGWGLRVQFHDS